MQFKSYWFSIIMEKAKDDLYSRQISSIGIDTNQKLSNLSILVIGLDLLGMELCKCLTLMGIGNIYIYDPQKYLREKDLIICKIPKNQLIDMTVVPYLQSLNRYVSVKTFRNQDILKLNLDIIIHTNICLTLPILKEHTQKSSIYLNEFCRKQNIRYILGFTVGFTGYIFQDFLKHTVLNDNGEKPKTCQIYTFTNKKSLSVLTVEKKHSFSIGDRIKINENDDIFIITNIQKDTIHLNKKIKINNENNLTMTEVKTTQNMIFDCLSSKLDSNPDITMNITSNKNSKQIKKDIVKLLFQPNNFYNDEYQLDTIVNNYRFPVIDSIIASIIAQEIVKITGTFTPLHQEFLIDYSEFYVKNDMYLNNLYKNKKKNFENIYGLLSKQMIKELKNLRFFVIGCGALGCEYLKLLSILDCASDKGFIDVIDMDNIELSNLNRQFLFSESDIGLSKSEVAVQKIKSMKSDIRIQSFNEKLDSNNEDKFSRTFWKERDIIINALDNVDARKYVDSQCVRYDKPLFEAGTLGTKCNLQIIKPYETACYSESIDPINEEIPYCTVKYFPSKIEHCIEWSLEIFHTYFNELMTVLNKFLSDKNDFLEHIHSLNNDSLKLSILQNITYLVDFLENENIDILHKFIKNIYAELYIIPVQSLIKSFPKELLVDNTKYFWSGDKIYPIKINHTEQYLVFSASFFKMLKSCISFSVNYQADNLLPQEVESIENGNLYKLSIKDNDKINIEGVDYTSKIDGLLKKLSGKKLHSKYSICKQDLNDTYENHISFIHNISNIRALIYSIKPINYIECKLLACKITPALSSTTTLITALSFMEILKYIYNKVNTTLTSSKKLQNYDYFINTGINLYLQSLPQKPKKFINDLFDSSYGCVIKTHDSYLTCWNKHIIPKKIITIDNLLKYLSDKYNTNIINISVDGRIYYNKGSFNKLDKQLIDIFTETNTFSENYLQFDIFSQKDEHMMILPQILFSRNE